MPKKPAARPAPKPKAKPKPAPGPEAVWKRLRQALPDPRCELVHQNAWQLLIATILSAQSTDARVNLVTPELFRRYPTPAALGEADTAELEQLVHSTGFFRNKAKSIRNASRIIAQEHEGEVPRTLDALIALPGVARKTANVVLGTAYGIASGVIVDTHAGRVARRLGLTTHTEPEKVEQALCELFPSRSWVALGHRLVLHGRYVCTARNPTCARCPLQEICPAAEAEPIESLTERAQWEAGRVEAARPADQTA